MTDSARLQRTLGYSFSDQELLALALTHRSAGSRNNERLEFLGDAVLGLVVNEDLYHKYPDRSEGDLTKMKALLVCGARLSEVAGLIDLGVHIQAQLDWVPGDYDLGATPAGIGVQICFSLRAFESCGSNWTVFDAGRTAHEYAPPWQVHSRGNSFRSGSATQV